MKKELSQIIKGIAPLKINGPVSNYVTGIEYDSRKIKEGNLFFALPGIHTDGNNFINSAIKNGARAVIYTGEYSDFKEGVCYIQVKDPRLSMAPVSADFYGNPSLKLKVIGVTGTEGKSTTVYLIYQLLNLLGKKCGFFSTVMSDNGTGEVPNPEHQTTPESPAVQRILYEMVENGCEYAVVESSSHGLSHKTGRLHHVHFDQGILMNVTQEHLEFHGTRENYAKDKANLFEVLGEDLILKEGKPFHKKTISGKEEFVPVSAVLKGDEEFAPVFRAALKREIPLEIFYTGGSSPVIPPADYKEAYSIQNIKTTLQGVEWDIVKILSGVKDGKYRISINIPGAFNALNTTAAIAGIRQFFPDLEENLFFRNLSGKTEKLLPVKGRMTVINLGQPFRVLVDYAHTPSSFETIFKPLRAEMESCPKKGRIIALFGSAGERDTVKRPRQGRIAGQYCDILILTDEDPRGEDSLSILKMISAGCPEKTENENLFLIPSRPEAIRKAFAIAKENDLVLLLGKGHENSIIYKDKVMEYDEISEAEKALKEMGFNQHRGIQPQQEQGIREP